MLAWSLAAADEPRERLVPLEIPAAPGSLAPSVATTPSGHALVTWLETEAEGGHALRLARLDGRDFGPATTVARGTDWFANWADTPRAFALDEKHWLVHWLTRTAEAPYAYHVRIARSKDGGASWDNDRRLHTDTSATEHGFVSYFHDAPGRAAVVWLDGRETVSGGAMTLRTARIVDGSPARERLLDARVCECCQTAGTLTADGPVVVYRDRTPDEVRDIAIVRRTGAGWTRPVRVHDDGWNIAGCPVNGPAVAALGNTVAVAWFTMAGGTPRVRVAVSQNAGAEFGAPTDLSTGDALGRVQIASHRDGFIATWMDEAESGAVLRMARLDRDGGLRGRRSLLSLPAGRVSGFPRIGLTGRGLLVVWTVSDPGDGARGTRVRAGLVDLAGGAPAG